MNNSGTGKKWRFASCLLGAIVIVMASSALILTVEFSSLPKTAPELKPSLPKDWEISNFSYVDDRLMRGAYPTPHGMEWLKKHSVRNIVDLREEGTLPVLEEGKVARAMGFNYLNISVRNLPEIEQLQAFQSFIEKARNNGERVFIHCNYGSDRTGLFVMFWRIQGEHWRPTLALAELFHHGFFVHKFSESKTKALSDPKNW